MKTTTNTFSPDAALARAAAAAAAESDAALAVADGLVPPPLPPPPQQLVLTGPSCLQRLWLRILTRWEAWALTPDPQLVQLHASAHASLPRTPTTPPSPDHPDSPTDAHLELAPPPPPKRVKPAAAERKPAAAAEAMGSHRPVTRAMTRLIARLTPEPSWPPNPHHDLRQLQSETHHLQLLLTPEETFSQDL
jgi:hypothetical protein